MKGTPTEDSAAGANAVPQMPMLWMIVPSFHPLIGGAEIQVKELSKAYLAEGWDVRVLTRRGFPLPASIAGG